MPKNSKYKIAVDQLSEMSPDQFKTAKQLLKNTKLLLYQPGLPQIQNHPKTKMHQSTLINRFRALLKQRFLFLIFAVLISCNGKGRTDKPEKPAPAEKPKTDTVAQIKNQKQPETPDTGIKAKDLKLFALRIIENKPKGSFGFISLSDVYSSGEHPDSLVFPDLQDKTFEEVQYLKFPSKNRKLFLAKIKVSESDKVFIYDYVADVLAAFPVSSLHVTATPSVYESKEDWPFPPENFMIGFEIKAADLKPFGEYLDHTLVYIGKESPFVRGQLKPVKWEKMPVKDFPATPTDAKTYSAINTQLREFIFGNNFSITDKQVLTTAFKYEGEGFRYFIKSFSLKREEYTEVLARHLLIFKAGTQELVCERTIVQSDGIRPVPLNHVEYSHGNATYQWTGKLFKDQPPVIFSFESFSFGCPEITVLDKACTDVYIYCDNRH